MAEISFFAKPAEYWERSKHLHRGSSLIRGVQIAEHLGAKLNPTSGYEDDICIYVKPPGKPHLYDYDLAGKPYIDIIDGEGIELFLQRKPEVPVIVVSKHDHAYLSELLTNQVILIPQHHCNFERVKRSRPAIKTVGAIGFPPGLAHLPDGLEKELNKRGLEFLTLTSFRGREDVADFLTKIDIYILWRPWTTQKLRNALSMINAMSFGIPTIAYEEETFKEFKGYYFPARSLDSFLDQLDMLLSSPNLYESFSKNLITKAEEFHIDKIGEMYKALCTPN